MPPKEVPHKRESLYPKLPQRPQNWGKAILAFGVPLWGKIKVVFGKN